MSYAAIPTQYRGTTFRSRLEAKWAAFFDIYDWAWRYEPVDLDGYIPDFTIESIYGPMLAEVKPIDFGADEWDLMREPWEKAVRAADGTKYQDRPMLFLGDGPFYCGDNRCVGVLYVKNCGLECVAVTTSGGLCSIGLNREPLTPTWDHIRDPFELATQTLIMTDANLDAGWGAACDRTAYRGSEAEA